MKKKIKILGYGVLIIIISFYTVSFVQLKAISVFKIFGFGMNVNKKYNDGDWLLVDKISYRLSTPKRGDVVVFSPLIDSNRKYLFKRVIGLPGDKVKIADKFAFLATAKNPTVFIKIDESAYLGNNFGNTCIYINCEGDEPVIFDIPAGHYFLMGDNRPASLDSRHCFKDCMLNNSFSSIPLGSISGKVIYLLGQFDKFEKTASVLYSEIK